MHTRRSTRIPLSVLPLHPEDRGGSLGSPKVDRTSSSSSSSAIKFSTTRSSLSFPTNAVASSSREPSPARRLFAEPSSSSSYGFGSPRSLTPKLGDLPSTDPPSPFLVTSQRSPTPYPVGSPNAFATSSASSPSRVSSSTPTRTPSRRLKNLPPPPPLQPDTPSASTGPGTAGCGFDIYHDGASPVNGASSSSSLLFDDNDLTVEASPAPSDSSIFKDYQPDKENKAPILIPSIPLCPSPLKRRRDLELEQQEEEEEEDEQENEDEGPVASTSSLTGTPSKGWKGKGRELSFVPEVEEEAEEELVSVVTSVSKGKGKSRATTRSEGKGKGRAILELEADEGDLVADEGLELTPGRRVPVVAVEKKRVAPGSPGKKRRGE
ncbi:hypothetical protein BDY24DRAFT_401508 [Mrakia frigida]|uniref:uncharacterized protein n=1 Tax=Mrakia frigida TaxID=29902 RepID=UPI003FCC2295